MNAIVSINIHVGEGVQQYVEEREFDTAEDLFDFLNCERFAGRVMDFWENSEGTAKIDIYDGVGVSFEEDSE